MPKYDAENFDPPAPVTYVTLRHIETGKTVSDVPMLIDTGADVTLVPIRNAVFRQEVYRSIPCGRSTNGDFREKYFELSFYLI